MIAELLAQARRAERAGHLDAALAIVESGAGEGPAAAAVLALVASRLALATAGPEPALLHAGRAGAAPEGAWSLHAAAHLAVAAAHLRIHTTPALEPARAAIAAAMRLIGGGLPAQLDPITEAAIAGAGDDARFLCRESLASHALELRGLAHARTGEVRAALADLEAAYAAGEGDPERRARVLLAWGLQLRNWGLLGEALRTIERSLELRLELDDLHGAAICQGVIAFVHQRRGDHKAERDALAADLRLCERIGSDADVPGLRARLAGALVGLGKYAAAWGEAEAAITAEDARLDAAGKAGPTRIHGFAWREQARVRLAEGRLDDAAARIDLAAAAFAAVGDAYAVALCEITSAEIALARGSATEALAARDRAAPVFARLGAILEAAELGLLAAQARGGDAGARAIVQRIVPALVEAGLGDTAVAARARALAGHLSAEVARDDVVARAARLPALAARALEEA